MTDTVFCKLCGEPLPADSKFCEHCGAEQEQRKAGSKFLPKIPADAVAFKRIDAMAPGTGEMASQLAGQLRTPTVTTSLVGGGLAAIGTVCVGLAFGLILSDRSALGLVDHGKGLLTAGFAQVLNFLQVGYGDGAGKLGPALFVIFPIAACAIAAATQARRTLGLPPTTRLAAGAGVGVVFGLAMLVPALAAGSLGGGPSTIDPDVLGAVLLGVLWGVIGGLLGTYYVMRPALERGFPAGMIPAQLGEAARTCYLALRPLALLLALMTLAGTLTWTVETLLKADLRDGDSTPVATIDHVAYAIEHGVHWTELAGLAQFRLVGDGGSSTQVPVPTGDLAAIKVDNSGDYRIFAFGRTMPVYAFAPLLIFMLGSSLLLALGAGFAVARSRLPDTHWKAAAWGSLVGPTWALTLLILNALLARDIFGRANGGSVFGTFLLGGVIVGAGGGLLSVQARRWEARGAAASAVVAAGGARGPGLP
jgi:hypothetical protein